MTEGKTDLKDERPALEPDKVRAAKSLFGLIHGQVDFETEKEERLKML